MCIRDRNIGVDVFYCNEARDAQAVHQFQNSGQGVAVDVAFVDDEVVAMPRCARFGTCLLYTSIAGPLF